MSALVSSLIRNTDGQDIIEYALLCAVLAVGFVAAINEVADGIIPWFDLVVAAFRGI